MLVVYTLGAIVFTIIALVPICNAQSASDDAAELQALRAELEREREAREQAEADAAEALAIAREAMEEADAAFVAPLLVGAPTQRVPSSGAVVYVDQLPPGWRSKTRFALRARTTAGGSSSCSATSCRHCP